MNFFIWILTIIVIALTIFTAADDDRNIRSQLIRVKVGKRRSLIIKRIIIWASPILVALLSLLSQIEANNHEREVTKLTDRLAPRYISNQQKSGILATLSPFSQDEIEVTWSPEKAVECQNYAEALADLLIDAGFKVKCFHTGTFFTDGETGVIISYTQEPNSLENVRRIRSAFSSNGILATYNGYNLSSNKSIQEPMKPRISVHVTLKEL